MEPYFELFMDRFFWVILAIAFLFVFDQLLQQQKKQGRNILVKIGYRLVGPILTLIILATFFLLWTIPVSLGYIVWSVLSIGFSLMVYVLIFTKLENRHPTWPAALCGFTSFGLLIWLGSFVAMAVIFPHPAS
jgi:hypothetical protein